MLAHDWLAMLLMTLQAIVQLWPPLERLFGATRSVTVSLVRFQGAAFKHRPRG